MHELFNLVGRLFFASTECDLCCMYTVSVNNREQQRIGRLFTWSAVMSELNYMPEGRDVVSLEKILLKVPNLCPMKGRLQMIFDEAVVACCQVCCAIVALSRN